MRENLIRGIEEMAITLRNVQTNEVLDLPTSLDWTDEFSYSPVQQTKTWSVTGAMLVEESVKQAGRTITLSGAADRTWCNRPLVQALQAWAALPNFVMQLQIRGIFHTVIFDHEKGALEGFPVIFLEDGSVDADTLYYVSLKFIEL